MVFVSYIVLMVAILTNLYGDYHEVGCLRYYEILAVLITVYFYYKSKRADDVHIHHYVICMVLLAFTGY